MSREHWAVTVERNGEQIVTISSNHLSGRDLSSEDKETIRTAARHLLSFIGEAAPPAPTAEPPILENAPPSKLDKLVEEYRAADVPCHDAVCPECGHYFETNIPEVVPPERVSEGKE